jgi:PilZ domain
LPPPTFCEEQPLVLKDQRVEADRTLTMDIERRQYVRIPGPFAASVRLDGRDVAVRVLDLSEGGCCVEGDRLQSSSELIVMEIFHPATGSVIVSGERIFGRPAGCAVLFGGMTAASKSKLERFIGGLRSSIL